jgi:hypothetical protein
MSDNFLSPKFKSRAPLPIGAPQLVIVSERRIGVPGERAFSLAGMSSREPNDLVRRSRTVVSAQNYAAPLCPWVPFLQIFFQISENPCHRRHQR